MLNSIPEMIKDESYEILNFFNNINFKPMLLDKTVRVRWPEVLTEFIFATPTSLIVKSTIEKALVQEGFTLFKEEN